MAFRKIVEWSPAWDRRSDDPNKNYGIHGMEVRFVLKGDEAATQFVIMTNWMLKANQEEMDRRPVNLTYSHLLCHPMPSDLGYHSLRPTYPEQDPITESCAYLDGRPCYYDGSGLQAQELYWRFVAEGEDVVWRVLEERYWDVVQRAAVLPLTVGPNGKSQEEI